MGATLEYRFARAEDIGDAARLVAHSFPGAARPPVWWEEQLRDPHLGGGPETLLLGFDQARLVAACQLHPLRQWIGGAPFAVAGVGSVAIAPTHRRRGIAAQLVTHALRAARERGDVASALYPFRDEFYHRLGYGRAGEVQQFQVPPAVFPDSELRQRVELLETDAAREDALRLYAQWIRGETGQLERPERLWSSLCTGHDMALVGYRNAAGTLEGYALVLYRADLPRRDRYLDVEELVWTSPEARRALYAWLGSLGDQWEQILLRALPSHRLADWLQETRLPAGAAPLWRLWMPSATLLHGTMFRLLDVRAAWNARAVAKGAALSIGLEVTDAQIAENAGSWTLSLADAQATLAPGAASSGTMRLDVATLSRLFIGSLAPTDALASGLLECDRPEMLAALDGALALPCSWTFDRF